MIKTEKSFDAECDNGILKVKLYGDIDHHSAINLRRVIDAKIYEERPVMLELDLSAINFMDSSGLGFIMGRYSLMRQFGGGIKVMNPNKSCMRILELAGIGRIIKIEKR